MNTKKKRILFTEGEDLRILEVAKLLSKQPTIQPIIYGSRQKIMNRAAEMKLELDHILILDPAEYDEKEQMIAHLLELRRGKIDYQQAQELIKKDTYFCTLYTEMGYADRLLGGCINSTADTLRPIMQLVKTKPGCNCMSSCFVMKKDDRILLFSDCSMNRDPDVDQLVEIAIETAKTATNFGIYPKVAMLSYSTKGSGKGETIDKVKEATTRLQRMALPYIVEGELQVDAALNPHVAELKCPNSLIKGDANVLIFPDLNAGNIGYKLVSNLGGYEAIGPILQGIRIPMNDLSRSATVDEIYKMALITAMQQGD